jgi:hypothetical protein
MRVYVVYVMYVFVSIYENRRLKLVEIVLRRTGGGKRENYRGGKSN